MWIAASSFEKNTTHFCCVQVNGTTDAAAEAALPVKAYEIPLEKVRKARRSGQRIVDGAFLEPHHTHFLLVDNGTNGMFGKEIELRARLEADIAASASGASPCTH